MENTFIKSLLNYGFKIRKLLNEGPTYVFYSLFWWCFPTTVLRIKAAKNPYADLRLHILRLSGIPIGKGAGVGYGSLILGRAKTPPAVTIGNRARIASYVTFITSSYPDCSRLMDHPEVKPMILKLGPIVVEEDCWVGANAIILPNVRLGRGCIVGAGSIVRKDVAPFSIVVGNPAKCIRTLDPMEFR